MKFLALLVLLFLPVTALAISASGYILMDGDSNRILAGENINDERLIASTTKIMTCIIALENKDINDKVKIGKEVLKAYGSAIYLSLDEEITLKDLLYGLMLRSGNDAAIAIAYYVSGSMQDFVKKMNEKAYELKMSHTTFVNDHGLEEDMGDGNTSTPYDMALLMSYALKNDTFREIIGTKNYTAKSSGKTYVWKNKNKLLFTYDNLIGGKTGFTKKARRTLVTAASKNGKTTIVVTLNDGNDFDDHKQLHEKGLSYDRVLLIDDEIVKNYLGRDDVMVNEPLYVLLTKKEAENVKLDLQVREDEQKEIGVLKATLNDEVLGCRKIYKVDDFVEVPKKGFWEKFFGWLFKW